MLSIEIRVNGSLVSAITAVNRGTVSGSATCVYEYQAVSFPMDSAGPCTTTHGDVRHKRTDGMEVLAEKLCHEAANMMRKK